MGDLLLSFPSYDGKRAISLPMASISRMEARQEEVQMVTRFKAPELLTALNRAWLVVSKMALAVNQHLLRAQRELEIRKAILLVDLLPDILVKKRLKTANEETRQGILVLDREYCEILDRVEQIRAVLEMLKVKAKGFQNSFDSVKKILGTSQLIDGTGPGSLSHRPGEDLPFERYEVNGLLCVVCDLPQRETPGGASCPGGHGGADGYDPETKGER